jgi:hypothetical protein
MEDWKREHSSREAITLEFLPRDLRVFISEFGISFHIKHACSCLYTVKDQFENLKKKLFGMGR